MNAYFRLTTSEEGTFLELFPPTDGGSKLDIAEVVEYLKLKRLQNVDIKELYAAVQSSEREVTTIPVSGVAIYPEQEMFALQISPDNMEAIARFYPPSKDGALLTKDEIMFDLQHRKVVFGICEDNIESFLANREYCKDILVARGQEPMQGTDAYVEYFFNTELNTRPKRNEDGSVDFHNLNTINHCKAGDILAKLSPMVQGEPGRSVDGAFIKPREVKNAFLSFGNNIELSEDKCELRSKLNGHVSLVGEKVFVSDVYEVKDVGPATGNIESTGNVIVAGNVQAGFSIKTSGDVEVKGIVEGACIEAGGNITLVLGMNGMGKGSLTAGGRIVARFLENARVKSGSYVEADSIIHCEVNAKTYVQVDGKKGIISGGVVRATEKITCRTLGSKIGTDTVVEVGMDPEVKSRYVTLQREIAEIEKNLKNMRPILAGAMQKVKNGEKLSAEQLKYIQSLAMASKQQQELLESDSNERNVIEEMLNNRINATIIVKDEVCTGTKIIVSESSLYLKAPAKYCRFIYEDGEVKMTSV